MSELDPGLPGPSGEEVPVVTIGIRDQPGLNGEELKRILRERARELAKPHATSDAPQALLDVLIFTLSGERYGVETRHVSDVGPLGEPTPLPGAPHFVRGIINHRGRILPVLDLRTLLELPARGSPDERHAITVEAAGMAFGILVEGVEGVTRIPAQDLSREAVSGLHNPWLLGATSDMAVILDLVALARDPCILVNDEAS